MYQTANSTRTRSTIISTHFNDVRLKNFIELRHWDSLPIERAERLTEIVSSLFYVPEHRERLESYLRHWRGRGVRGQGQHSGPRSRGFAIRPAARFLEEFLGLEGLLSDIPGDRSTPTCSEE